MRGNTPINTLIVRLLLDVYKRRLVYSPAIIKIAANEIPGPYTNPREARITAREANSWNSSCPACVLIH